MKEIYKYMKEIRIKKGLSQEYMARKLKIAQNNYGKLERGSTNLTIRRLEEIAGIFNMTINEIINYGIEISVKKLNQLEQENTKLKQELIDTRNKVAMLEENIKLSN